MRYIRIGYIQGNDLMTHDSRHRHKNNSGDTFTNVAYYKLRVKRLVLLLVIMR